jgi:hypothetical protein
MGNCCAQETSRAAEVVCEEKTSKNYTVEEDKKIPVKAALEMYPEKASQASKPAVNAQHEQSSEFTATSLPELILPVEIESKLRQIYPSLSKRLKEEMTPGNEFIGRFFLIRRH